MGKGKKSAKIAGRGINSGKAVEVDTKGRYLVAHRDDLTRLKYARVPEGEGFSHEHALFLAARAHDDQPAYVTITLEEYQRVTESAEPVSYQQIVAARNG